MRLRGSVLIECPRCPAGQQWQHFHSFDGVGVPTDIITSAVAIAEGPVAYHQSLHDDRSYVYQPSSPPDPRPTVRPAFECPLCPTVVEMPCVVTTASHLIGAAEIAAAHMNVHIHEHNLREWMAALATVCGQVSVLRALAEGPEPEHGAPCWHCGGQVQYLLSHAADVHVVTRRRVDPADHPCNFAGTSPPDPTGLEWSR